MRVWITRDEEPGGPLAIALAEVGLEPVLEPVLARRVVDDARAEIAALGPDDWLVLTSPFAVRAVPADVARVPRVAVVGGASGAVAAARGLRVALVGAGGGAAGLFAELAPRAAGTTVCYPRSSLATPPPLGADVRVVSPVLYETVARAFRRAVAHEIDVVTVASPSAVRGVGVIDRPYASIGPTTTAALAQLGLSPWVEASPSTLPALARAIADRAR